MIEILEHLDVLTQPDLDLATLTLAGVPFGSKAADSVPRERITEVSFSPLVHRSVTDDGQETRYYGADGRRLALDDVIDSVLTGDGMVHFADQVSYKIAGGTVVGFAIYGADRGHLAHFDSLRSYQAFLALFGEPDRIEESRAFGDLVGYDTSYRRSRKLAYWSCWDEAGRGQLSSISLGDYDELSAVI